MSSIEQSSRLLTHSSGFWSSHLRDFPSPAHNTWIPAFGVLGVTDEGSKEQSENEVRSGLQASTSSAFEGLQVAYTFTSDAVALPNSQLAMLTCLISTVFKGCVCNSFAELRQKADLCNLTLVSFKCRTVSDNFVLRMREISDKREDKQRS